MSRLFLLVGAMAAAALPGGCDADLKAHSQPTDLTPLSAPADRITLARRTPVPLGHGFEMGDLRSGSQWTAAGQIDGGRVYRPLDSEIMVDAGDLHEAYLVVSGGQIVGVYLPVQKSYIEASRPVALDQPSREGSKP